MVDFKFKVIVTGSNSVGKTSLVRRYVDDMFSESYIPTLLTDFTTKDIRYKGTEVRLLLYEMGGEEQFRENQKRHFNMADYIVAVASVDNNDSLNRLPELMSYSSSVWKNQNHGKDGVLVVVALNKIDLVKGKNDEIAVLYRYKKRLQAVEKPMGFNGILFTSAKSGEGVDVLFNKIAVELLRKKTSER